MEKLKVEEIFLFNLILRVNGCEEAVLVILVMISYSLPGSTFAKVTNETLTTDVNVTLQLEK